MGSAGLFVVLCLVGVVVWVVEPPSKFISGNLALWTDQGASGWLWQFVTWPFSMIGFGLWTVLNLIMVWFFGGELERMIGRFRFGWLLVALVVGLGLLATAIGLIAPGSRVLAGPGIIAGAVILLSIAEFPHRPFFGLPIPMWVVAAVYLGVMVLVYLASRDFWSLAMLVASMVVGALAAKQFGLLRDYRFIPQLVDPDQRRRRQQQRRASKEPTGPTLVPMTPRSDYHFQVPPDPPQSQGQARMDELLDQVSSKGLDSLTPAERSELEQLSRNRFNG